MVQGDCSNIYISFLIFRVTWQLIRRSVIEWAMVLESLWEFPAMSPSIWERLLITIMMATIKFDSRLLGDNDGKINN